MIHVIVFFEIFFQNQYLYMMKKRTFVGNEILVWISSEMKLFLHHEKSSNWNHYGFEI